MPPRDSPNPVGRYGFEPRLLMIILNIYTRAYPFLALSRFIYMEKGLLIHNARNPIRVDIGSNVWLSSAIRLKDYVPVAKESNANTQCLYK